MRRAILALAATLALAGGTSASALGDLTDSQVTLSCNDGHSAIVYLDSTAITELASEIAAINAGDSGLSCTLSQDSLTTSSSGDPAKWTVYDYNPSDQAIRPRNSPNSMPATTEGNTTSFPFKVGIYTALLTTRDKALTGDQSTSMLQDDITLDATPDSVFQSQHGDGCNYPPNVRFYFTAPSASGASAGSPRGYYTAFWWSNPANFPLVDGGAQPGGQIHANLSDPAEWSDWNGQSGANPAVTPAFEQAIHNIQTIGLSYGGGCFFENGVTITSGSATFNSTFTETPTP